MWNRFGIHDQFSINSEWIIETESGYKSRFWGVLKYDYESGPVITGCYAGDLSVVQDSKGFFIVYSVLSGSRGCALINAHVRNFTNYAGCDTIDIVIVGTHIITNCSGKIDGDLCFVSANLYYDNMVFYWNEMMVDAFNRRRDGGIITTCDEKVFLETMFMGCDVKFAQYLSVSSERSGGVQIIPETVVEVVSSIPLDFSGMYKVIYNINKCINFAIGNTNNFSRVSFCKQLETEDAMERFSKTSYVVFNNISKNNDEGFIPVVEFIEGDESSSVVGNILNAYEKYRVPMLASVSAVEVKHDIVHKFFSMCRALEAAVSGEKVEKDSVVEKFIQDAIGMLPKNVEKYELIVSRLKSVNNDTFAERLNKVDFFIYDNCGMSSGLSYGDKNGGDGLSKEIAKARNTAAHYNANINKVRGVDFYEYYWVVKKSLYAYIFLNAGVSAKFVKDKILQNKYLAE